MSGKIYKFGAIIFALIAVFILSFTISLKRSEKTKVSEKTDQEQTVMSSTNIIEENTVEKNGNDENSFNEISQGKEQKTSSKIVNEVKTNNEENVKEQVQKEETEDPVFMYPVKGEIINDYAKEKLVYSNTLGEWVTHLGIDIKANKTTVVAASADGKVKSIKNDPRYGLSVVIEHSNGFSTLYANLLTAEFVSVGQNVKSGQSIGTVGNTASFEILDEPHLHFEILKDNVQIDPNMYLKN